MPTTLYYGSYVTFETESKKAAAALMGADNLIGDVFSADFVFDGGSEVAWMVNKFGAKVGYFDAETTHQLALCKARGWKTDILLVSVYFTDNPEPGYYWGEAAIISYPEQQADDYRAFISGISGLFQNGIRPAVDLSRANSEKIVESHGTWLPTDRVAEIPRKPGTACVKKRRSFSEKMIELARARNMGCMIAGWAFLLLLVAAVAFGFKSCGII